MLLRNAWGRRRNRLRPRRRLAVGTADKLHRLHRLPKRLLLLLLLMCHRLLLVLQRHHLLMVHHHRLLLLVLLEHLVRCRGCDRVSVASRRYSQIVVVCGRCCDGRRHRRLRDSNSHPASKRRRRRGEVSLFSCSDLVGYKISSICCGLNDCSIR